MRPQIGRLILLAAAASMGCGPQLHDPAQGGFLEGVGALATGGYDARIADREAALANLQDQADALRQRREEAEGQQRATRSELESAEEELTRLRKEQRRLDDALSRARKVNKHYAATLSGVQRRANHLREDIQRLSGSGSPERSRVQELEAERRSLCMEVRVRTEGRVSCN